MGWDCGVLKCCDDTKGSSPLDQDTACQLRLSDPKAKCVGYGLRVSDFPATCSRGRNGDPCLKDTDCYADSGKWAYCCGGSDPNCKPNTCLEATPMPVGAKCSDDSQCQTKRCVDNVCRRNDGSCDNDDDCDPWMKCMAGVCKSPEKASR